MSAMTTKARAIAALAKLRNRPTSRYSPAALDEELVDAVLGEMLEPSEGMKDAMFEASKHLGLSDEVMIEMYHAAITAIRADK